MRRFVSWGILCLTTCLWPGARVDAQPGTAGIPANAPDSPVAGSAAVKLTVPTVEDMARDAAKNMAVDAATQKAIADYYAQAITSIKQADALAAKIAEYDRQIGTVSAQLADVQKKAAALPKEAKIEVPGQFDNEVLERQIAQRKTRLDHPDTGLRKKLSDLDAELARRAKRLKDLPGLQATAEAKLEDLTKQQDLPAPEGEDPSLTQARKISLYAQRMVAAQEIGSLKREQAWYEAQDSGVLIREQKDYVTREIALQQEELNKLQTRLGERRAAEAEMRVKQAQQEAALTHPILKPLAEENEALARQNHEQTELNERTAERLEKIKARKLEIETDFNRIKTMVAQVQLTESIGLLLRNKRQTLLRDPNELKQELKTQEDTLRTLQLKGFELEDQLNGLNNIDAAVGKVLDDLKSDANQLPRETLEAQAAILLTKKRELLLGLQKTYSTAIDNQLALDGQRQQLANSITAYARYIDERVLWIRTGSPLTLELLKNSQPAWAWLMDRENWGKVGESLSKDLQHNFPLYLLAGAGLLPLVVMRRRIRTELQSLGDQASAPSCRDFTPTARALVWTALLAMGWPAVMAFLGWRLELQGSKGEFSYAVARALLVAAAFALPVQALKLVCSRKGLGGAHFQWSDKFVKTAHRSMRTVLLAGTPLVFVSALMGNASNEAFMDTAGRPLFLVLLLLIAVAAWRTLFGTQTPAATESDIGAIGPRLRVLAKYAAVSIPLCLGALVYLGYLYTAGQLAVRINSTYWLLISLMMVNSLVMRWITIERKKLALAQVKQMRQAAEDSVRQAAVPAGGFSLHNLLLSQFKLDLATIVNQVRSLLQTVLGVVAVFVLWLIWSDVVPALGILDRWELWQTSVQISPSVTPGSGGVAGLTPDTGAANPGPAVTQYRYVTAKDLCVALIVLVVSLLASRNIPGLMEVLLLRRLSSDRGFNLAVITLVRYILFTIGFVWAFGQIGVGWSNVQWLVAAATVGLGFGLQEIFANFVSGLIILIERPIREGDVVTVGDTSGTVAKIKFRATTIIDWDRKELVVPNKEFITSKVLNWTLSNTINRLTLKVGVAYGSDVYEVNDLLMELVKSQPGVMTDPAPSVTLDELGANSLNFTIRLFLPTLDDRMRTMHNLYALIYQRLNEEGFEISFPQMDLHLRSVPDNFVQAMRPVIEVHDENGHPRVATAPRFPDGQAPVGNNNGEQAAIPAEEKANSTVRPLATAGTPVAGSSPHQEFHPENSDTDPHSSS